MTSFEIAVIQQFEKFGICPDCGAFTDGGICKPCIIDTVPAPASGMCTECELLEPVENSELCRLCVEQNAWLKLERWEIDEIYGESE